MFGDYANTAKGDDHTLSVVQIGSASVARTIQLDVATDCVGWSRTPTSPWLATPPCSHAVAVVRFQSGTRVDQIVSPPPDGSGLVQVTSNDDPVR
jgi:hypothetical protein